LERKQRHLLRNKYKAYRGGLRERRLVNQASLIDKFVGGRSGNWLDIGTCDGRIFYLSKSCLRRVGLDLVVYQKIDIPFVVGDGEALPFANETFDFISSLEVIEHCPNDEMHLREIHRVLKGNGLLFLGTTSSRRAENRLQLLLRRRPIVGDGHAQEYTTRSLLELLGKFGFEAVYKEYYYLPLIPVRHWKTSEPYRLYIWKSKPFLPGDLFTEISLVCRKSGDGTGADECV